MQSGKKAFKGEETKLKSYLEIKSPPTINLNVLHGRASNAIVHYFGYNDFDKLRTDINNDVIGRNKAETIRTAEVMNK